MTAIVKANSEMVCSRIGGGMANAPLDPLGSVVSTLFLEYPEHSEEILRMMNRYIECVGFSLSYLSMEPRLHTIEQSTNQSDPEPNWYIYHSDHLGSSAFLTDASGDPTQHLQYMPFGETFVEQRSTTSYYTPYTFSAKERDTETGYSYFGARYYDADISVWLSVDPMADKYPSMSAYMYCAGNPVMLVDPDGREMMHAQNISDPDTDPNAPPRPVPIPELHRTMQESFKSIVDYVSAEGFVEANYITRTRQGMANFAAAVLDLGVPENPELIEGDRKPVNGVTVEVALSFDHPDPNNPEGVVFQIEKFYSRRPYPMNESTSMVLNPGLDPNTVPYIELTNGSKLYYVILVSEIPEA